MSPLVSEKKEVLPILIVDKVGAIGNDLSSKLLGESTVVFVTQNEPDLENILFVPFENKIPKVPDNVYSHIFVIDDGEEITFDFLSSFLDKAINDKSVFCFCTSLENQNKIPQQLFEYRKTRIVFLGDIFPAKNGFSKSYVNKFINSSKNKGKIMVPQEGMAKVYPVFWDDAILGILEASFGTSQEKIYYDFPKRGMTLLSLAHTIQRINPDVKIDFSKDDFVDEAPIKREGINLLSNNYTVEDKLRSLRIVKEKIYNRQEEDRPKKETNSPKVTTTSTRLFFFSILLFVFLPLISTLLSTFIAFLSLDFAKNLPNQTKLLLNFSMDSFNLAEGFSNPLIFETQLLQIAPFTKLIDSIEENRKEIGNVLDYYNSLDLLGNQKIAEGTALLKNSIVFGQSKKLMVVDPELQDFLSQTIEVWPQIFGVGSRKTYLILFQNNLTPRPTGGLIEAFGLLSLNDGKFGSFKIFDTNSSDKNLKGHVEPPFAVRRYLSSSNFFMKDSNFNPDFLETAASSSFFVNLEQGEKPDGVIGVDSNFIQQLAKKLNVNIESLSLQNSVEEISKRLQTDNSFKILLSRNFTDLIQKKDIIFQFNDQSIENAFLSNNFSSSLLDTRENSQKRINDYVSLVESDFGSPVNNIDRNLTDKVSISENGEVSEDLVLEYKNSGDNDYRNYLRFITPNASVITKIKIDGADTDFIDAITDPSVYEAKDFTPPSKLEVERYSDFGKNFSGFLVNISKGSTKTIEITYKFNPITLSGLPDFSYNLKVFKQPGIYSYPFNFSISYPDSFKTSDKTSFSKVFNEDFNLKLNFFQK